MKVKNYKLWMNSYKRLTIQEYNSYMNIRNIDNIIYFQEINEYINSNSRLVGSGSDSDIGTTNNIININDDINKKEYKMNKDKDSGMGSDRGYETIHEMHFIGNLQKYQAYQTYAMENMGTSSSSSSNTNTNTNTISGSRYLVGANNRGSIDLSSYTEKSFEVLYTAGWPIFTHLFTIRPNDMVVVTTFRTASFDNWMNYMHESHIIERWSRLGLLHMFAGLVSDKLGQTIVLVSIFDHTTSNPTTTSNHRLRDTKLKPNTKPNGDTPRNHAIEFNSWYKDLINNGLSRMFKSNLRSFALAPCNSNVYIVTDSSSSSSSSNGCDVNSKAKHCKTNHDMSWISDLDYNYY